MNPLRTLFTYSALLAGFLCSSLHAQTTNVAVPAKVLDSYVGQYELAPGFVLTVRKDGEKLTAQATGQPPTRLRARSETDFEVLSVNASITFNKDTSGKVTSLTLHQNGDHEATKTSSTVPKERVAIALDPKIAAAIVGQYELAPGSILTIQRDGEKVRAQLTDQPSVLIYPETEKDFFYKVVDAQITFEKDPSGKVTGLVLHQNGDKPARKISDTAPSVKRPDVAKIPSRDPKAGPRLVDLTGKYYSPLTEQWHPNASGLPENENHLGSLPRGIQTFNGVEFDVRGVIQVNGTAAEFAGAAFPDSANGIKIGKKCKRLHFLHATGWSSDDGTAIGKYVLHYAGGQTATLDIIYGVDLRDWWVGSDGNKQIKSATVAWTGSSPAADAVGSSIRLFKRTYDNPKPELEIQTLDFVSTKAESAPFLVAITAEE